MSQLRKLVVYRSQEARRKQAGAYSNLVNYDAQKHVGVFDDGHGHHGHVEFAVAEKIDAALGAGYDTVEFIGFGE